MFQRFFAFTLSKSSTRFLNNQKLRLPTWTLSARCLSSLPSQFSSSSSSSDRWRILRLNHIAIATGSTDRAADLFRSFFNLQPSAKVPQPDHGVHTVFLDVGNTKLELLDPLGVSSPIRGFVEKNPAGAIHHLCFEVDDIEAAVRDLKAKGVRLLSEQTKIGAHGKSVIFIHPKDCSGVLVELQQA